MRLMHQFILGAGLPCALLAAALGLSPDVAAASAAKAAASATCPSARAATQEVFIAADCDSCWSAPPADSSQAFGGWRFDWIMPGAADAPLAGAALREAGDRLQRLAQTAPPANAQRQHRQKSAAGPGPITLDVAAGLPMNGYYALQLSVGSRPGQALPAGSSAWLALVEMVPAGRDGTPVARALVRSVAGPLSLQALRPGKALDHLAAMRWPEGAQIDRLQARGWVEAPDGRLLAVVAERCRP